MRGGEAVTVAEDQYLLLYCPLAKRQHFLRTRYMYTPTAPLCASHDSQVSSVEKERERHYRCRRNVVQHSSSPIWDKKK